MRNWSFFLTTEQVRNQSKRVTRRKVSPGLPKVGELRQPVVKMQGIPKGGHVEKIGGPVRVTDVRIEPLDHMQPEDLALEGFPGYSLNQFFDMFRRSHGMRTNQEPVARIEFEYVAGEGGV